MQGMEDALVYYAEQQAWYSFIEALRMEHFYNWMMQEQFPICRYTWWGFGPGRNGGTVVGSYSYDCRTGVTTFDRRGLKSPLTNDERRAIEKNINLNIYPDVENKSDAKTNFWKSFWEGHEEVSDEQIYFLTHAQIHVDIRQEDNYFKYSICNSIDYELATGIRIEDPAAVLGWTTYCDWGTIMTFSEAIFSDNYEGYGRYVSSYGYNQENEYGTFNRTMAIMHEFGHSFAYFNMGNMYSFWGNNYVENQAIWYMNTNYNASYGYRTQCYQGLWRILYWFGLTP